LRTLELQLSGSTSARCLAHLSYSLTSALPTLRPPPPRAHTINTAAGQDYHHPYLSACLPACLPTSVPFNPEPRLLRLALCSTSLSTAAPPSILLVVRHQTPLLNPYRLPLRTVESSEVCISPNTRRHHPIRRHRHCHYIDPAALSSTRTSDHIEKVFTSLVCHVACIPPRALTPARFHTRNFKV
jgi:hypothetical protein